MQAHLIWLPSHSRHSGKCCTDSVCAGHHCHHRQTCLFNCLHLPQGLHGLDLLGKTQTHRAQPGFVPYPCLETIIGFSSFSRQNTLISTAHIIDSADVHAFAHSPAHKKRISSTDGKSRHGVVQMQDDIRHCNLKTSDDKISLMSWGLATCRQQSVSGWSWHRG